MIFCTVCGTQMENTALFCSGCGNKLAIVEELKRTGLPSGEINVPKNNKTPDSDNKISGFVERISARIFSLLSSLPVFILIYIFSMVPTYLLPYFGSNSTVLNVAAAAAGLAGTLPFWLHLGFLWVLVSCAIFRGAAIGRNWLPVLPVVAGSFDMLPGLSMIPLVPTALHLATLILGSNRMAAERLPQKKLLQLFFVSVAGLAGAGIGALWQVATLDDAFFGNDAGNEVESNIGSTSGGNSEIQEAAPSEVVGLESKFSQDASITETGMFGMKVGDAYESVSDNLIKDNSWDISTPGCTLYYVKGQSQATSVYLKNGKISDFRTYDNSIKTHDGIHVGSSYSDLKKIYGDSLVLKDSWVNGGGYLYYPEKGRYMKFDVTFDQVTFIFVGDDASLAGTAC